jgi:hypothetical protein
MFAGGSMVSVAVGDGSSGASGVGYGFSGTGWHFLGYSTCGMVLDGVEVPGGSGCSTSVMGPSSAPLRIGGPSLATAGGDAFYAGKIDEVRIWNVGRTPATMIAEMSMEMVGTEPGLVFYANFEDGPGPTTADLSPTALVCTLGTVTGPDAADPTWSPDVPF